MDRIRSLTVLLFVAALTGGVSAQERGGSWLRAWLSPYRHESQSRPMCPPATVAPSVLHRDYPYCRWRYVPAQQSFGRRDGGIRPSSPHDSRPLAADLHAPENRDDLVREVQLELAMRGYYPGELDGVDGQLTQASAIAFQRDAGVYPDGHINVKLWTQLQWRVRVSSLPWAGSTPNPSPVGRAQYELSRLGYYSGPMDGLLNPATRLAIREYRAESYARAQAQSVPRGYEATATPLAEQLAHVPSSRYEGPAGLAQTCGISALTAGNYGEALRLSTAVIRASAASADARHCSFLARGLVHLARGEATRAIQDFTSVLRLSPSSADAYYNRALAYQAAGLPALGRRDYREALRLDPDLGAVSG